MANLETSWMGLKLKNPIIAASSGLTNSVENIVELERNGVGAVVLKSLFEEQIANAVNQTMEQGGFSNYYSEAEDYIRNYTQGNDLSVYLELIRTAKQIVKIPVIASINCVSDSDDWISFAKKTENAGADALELNIFILPSDTTKRGEENEKLYFDIVEKVTKEIAIPVALKISCYFSGLAQFITKLSWTNIKGIVLFNRSFSPDIDIDKMEVKSSFVFSDPASLALSLRWIAMMSPHVKCDLAASTGVHDGEAVIKQLLAGAQVVQIASVLYKKGFAEIGEMTRKLEAWMEKKNFNSLDDFRGKLNTSEYDNPAAYERVQFMKHFSGIE
ncbi:MAG: diguanylate cyclase [Bacteroidetes bacterium]|nr:MAG: diguanylate cyclase [Bacteroidota bacterium]